MSRSLEPYRGFHVLMRALPDVLAARPDAQVVLVGAEGTSYGAKPRDANSWKDKLLAEVGAGWTCRGCISWAACPMATICR